MLFKPETSLLTWGDFIDVYYKIKFKGAQFIFSRLFKFSYQTRVSTKWDAYASVSDFWIIPEIKRSWNMKITGNPTQIYEDYVCERYLQNKDNLNLLSIGCGEGGHERNFAKHAIFNQIVGIDVSAGSIATAKSLSAQQNLTIAYRCDDFFKIDFANQKFDLILFNASLHHFDHIDALLKNHISPLLNENGLVVVNEFCGPTRLQWRKSQLKEANKLLGKLPAQYKKLADGKNLKKKVYRPGLIRMLLNDPSEAPDSINLVQALRDNFEIVEETQLGWTILHILLKDIAHNFLSEDALTKNLLHQLIADEDAYVKRSQENDALFGVYRKKSE